MKLELLLDLQYDMTIIMLEDTHGNRRWLGGSVAISTSFVVWRLIHHRRVDRSETGSRAQRSQQYHDLTGDIIAFVTRKISFKAYP